MILILFHMKKLYINLVNNMRDIHIHKEVMANQVAGFIFGYLVTTYITVYLIENKIFAIHVIGLATATIFFAYSYVRMYFFRWLFKLLEHKMSIKVTEQHPIDNLIMGVKVTVRLQDRHFVEINFPNFEYIDLGQVRDSVEGYALANSLLKYKAKENPWEGKNECE